MAEATVGFIGGSGLYDVDGMAARREVEISTPFGYPSDKIVLGELEGAKCAFLPRHGRGHRLSPSEIPARANIYALKSLGVERLVTVSAVGSLREELRPLDLVIPDQLIDRTRERPSTFFGNGVVAHVGLADPFCAGLRRAAMDAAAGESVAVHDGGVYVSIEGPQFSTRAESAMHRAWGASVVGMTALPEARLAREAELCYATLAFVTDYDVWREPDEDVTVEMVIQNLTRNAAAAQSIVRRIAGGLTNERRRCGCGNALETAIITSGDLIPADARRRLALFIDKYLA